MAENGYAVVLFHSTQGAFKAERALVKAGFTVKLIPTPRQLSSNCGTALRCSWDEIDGVRSALGDAKAEFDRIHRLPVR